MNSTTNTRSASLVLTWVSVTDVGGRERLEAHWAEAPQSPPSHVTHAA